MAFGSVVAVLWYGAQSVLAGELSPGTLGQFLLYSVFAAGSLGALSEVWGELSQAAGAAERLSELLDEVPEIRAPENPVPLPQPPVGDIRFDNVDFAYPARPDTSAWPARVSMSARRNRRRRGRVRRGEIDAVLADPAVLRRHSRAGSGRHVDVRDADPADVRARIAWCRRM
jgi:ATP-binding cassette subfamily B protein